MVRDHRASTKVIKSEDETYPKYQHYFYSQIIITIPKVSCINVPENRYSFC